MIDLIIPAYNAEDTIGRALGSVVAQTRPRKFLVTVIDDCSTDATEAIVKKFKGLLPLQYIKLEKNLGRPGLVRNVGIERTNCPYIMFLDADDILAPNAGEVLSRAILQNKPDFISSSFYQDTQDDVYNIIKYTALTWLHGNIYSRNFLEEKNIMFDNKMNEDGSFNLKCFWMSKNKATMGQPMSYWLNNKNSLTRKNNNFMLDIANDYIKTYNDAIYMVIKNDITLIKDNDFIKTCAYKAAEFIQLFEGLLGANRDTSFADAFIQEYIDFMKSINMINKNFIILMNRHFNRYEILPDIMRQHTLTYYIDKFNIKGE